MLLFYAVEDHKQQADAGRFFCLRGDMAEGFNILEFIYL